MTAHELKIWPVYFQAVIEGRKTFEVRRNDRDFKVGDTLRLREFNPENGGSYTGREVCRAITYLSEFAQELGYVVLALSTAPAGEARLRELATELVNARKAANADWPDRDGIPSEASLDRIDAAFDALDAYLAAAPPAPAGDERLRELEAGVRKLQRELADDAMSPMFSTPEAGMLTGIASRLDALLRSAADAPTPTAGAHIIDGLETLSAGWRTAPVPDTTYSHGISDGRSWCAVDLDAFIASLKEQENQQ